MVGKARNDMLTHTLIDFLMGETDGVPKDPNYIYRLYMALGSYSQAAKTAIIIAKQEQDLGNYKVGVDAFVRCFLQLWLGSGGGALLAAAKAGGVCVHKSWRLENCVPGTILGRRH